MALGSTAGKGTGARRQRGGAAAPALAVLLFSACASLKGAGGARDAAIDRLLALPLERLVTAPGDDSIWEPG